MEVIHFTKQFTLSENNPSIKLQTNQPLPTIRTIYWQPPRLPWIKVNTDGASKGNPGPSSCGAVFRSHEGYFLGGFSVNLGFQDALYAELMAIVLAVEWAWKKGWDHLWLESDSTTALSVLDDNSKIPPSPRQLRDKWMQCKSKIKKMNFYRSHIYREGNAVADFLANMGFSHSSMCWWDFPPHEHLQQLLLEDIHGVPKFRVR